MEGRRANILGKKSQGVSAQNEHVYENGLGSYLFKFYVKPDLGVFGLGLRIFKGHAVLKEPIK